MSCENQKINADVGYLDIEIAQGSDTSINIEYKIAGVTVDLSTYSARLQVRKNYGSSVLLELTSDTSTITLDSTSPNIILLFESDTTAAMNVYDSMLYDLEIESSGGAVTKILRGNFSLVREITI